MSDCYSYSSDHSIIIQEGNMIWNHAVHDQSSLQYFDANDTVITDATINESYATAIDSNETQYLSILDSSGEATLENINLSNITLGDMPVEENIVFSGTDPPEQIPNEENDNSQVVVFAVEGSDDLYGLQLSQDQEGNIQKYQFQFRTNHEGNLEAIPETIQLLPPDDNALGNEAAFQQEIQSENESNDLQDYLLAQSQMQNNNENDSNTLESTFQQIPSDSDLLQLDDNKSAVNIKTEVYIPSQEIDLNCVKREQVFNNDDDEDHPDYIQENHGFDGVIGSSQHLIFGEQVSDGNFTENMIQENDSEPCDNEVLENNDENIVQQLMNDNGAVEVEFDNGTEDLDEVPEGYPYNDVYNQECENVSSETETCSASPRIESDSDAYQIADDFQLPEPQAEDIEACQYQITSNSNTEEIIVNQQPILEKSNILKHSSANLENKNSKQPFVNVKYYIVYPEKENVNALVGQAKEKLPNLSKLPKSNPRSVLRTSFVKPKEVPKCVKNTEFELPECDLFQKRFAKSKEAMQAKLFHNFINGTTIPVAPVRQTRQPRKQKIKPVQERRDEEIIVQEVMISSTGFVQDLNKKLRNKKVEVSAVVELSDSEEEPNSKSRRVTVSESELSVVEIHSDDDSLAKSASKSTVVKRRRGRPPKKPPTEKKIELTPIIESVSFNSNQDIEEKIEFPCPHCSKSFPSQNSLNTHKIHHNLENSLKEQKKMNSSRVSVIPRRSILPMKFEYNHKCEKCEQNFKNNALLQRHECRKKQSDFNCSVCLKSFRDVALLNMHKKSHVKSNLVKNTSIEKVSPKKSIQKPLIGVRKSSLSGFKCKECEKVCETRSLLDLHVKTHKKFTCLTCSATFTSRLLLDTHIRIDCVKFRSPKNKRLSFKIRKSFIQTPPRRLSIAKVADRSLRNSTLATILECEVCKSKFTTYRNLYTHKVQKHGMSTPDKSLMAGNRPKQGLYRPKPAHGGIPANDRMKKAFAALRMKLAESQEVQKITGSTVESVPTTTGLAGQ
ncbi:zinc finger and BTB domain-containing protein 11-like [Sitophilus oryzae]|uniref:Zinc finger and BTB domain-containing protein 11-like n=1 Tax=Sitophilus oryzae TaxID=7048 RepID=A0A6J2X7G0_SITOR|nr:zinc finger and BTB domain-containing protein 11-like [Sitophilus oryzae]XP_030746930.1 zinc finger and BTB domain-containing protein 11-like [Sitophilus oryzae]